MQTILITGANAGLGLSLSKIYLKNGFKVISCYREGFDNLENIKKKHEENLILVHMDVTSFDMIKKVAASVSSGTDHIDILINNAGIYTYGNEKSLEELDFDDFGRTMDVNAFGPLKVVQQFLPLLNRGNKKLIINISSEAGSINNCKREGVFAYCMSKAALNMESKILQNYLGKKEFKVLSVHPGWVRSNMGGPNASVDPDESAEYIYNLSIKSWKINDPIYFDRFGNLLEW